MPDVTKRDDVSTARPWEWLAPIDAEGGGLVVEQCAAPRHRELEELARFVVIHIIDMSHHSSDPTQERVDVSVYLPSGLSRCGHWPMSMAAMSSASARPTPAPAPDLNELLRGGEPENDPVHAWMEAHAAELASYSGQRAAIDPVHGLLAVGPTYEAVAEKLDALGIAPDAGFVIVVVD